jgi:hypothetical protein
MAAAPGEHVGIGPRATDEVMGLVVLLAQRGGIGAAGVVVVHRSADREAADQASAGYAVDHCHFLRDAGRRVVEGDGLAEQQDGRVACAAREGRRHQLRRRHQAVGVLVMLVDAEAVEAEIAGVFQEIQVVVVDPVGLARVEQARIDVDPHAAMLFGKVVGQVGPGHEIEPVKLHRVLLDAAGALWGGRRPAAPRRTIGPGGR